MPKCLLFFSIKKNSKKMLQEKLIALKFLFNFNQPGGQFRLLPPRTWK